MTDDSTKCLKFDWQKIENKINGGLFEIEGNPTTTGFSLFAFGFAVKLLEPRSELFVDFNGSVQVAGGGQKFIFNHSYGTGDYVVCIIARKSKSMEWQAHHFDIHVDKKIHPPGSIITNFFRSKAIGQITGGAEGLDVVFSLSLGSSFLTIKWYFEKDTDGNFIEDVKSRNDRTAHFIYRKIGDFKGKVVVTDHQNKQDVEEFTVSVTGIS